MQISGCLMLPPTSDYWTEYWDKIKDDDGGVVGWGGVECSRNQDQSDYPDLAGWF